jgi:hypothetical protein
VIIVWYFLRHCHISYCSLYDSGYTSLGNIDNTVPNSALLAKSGSTAYRPAYELKCSELERENRSHEVASEPADVVEVTSQSDATVTVHAIGVNGGEMETVSANHFARHIAIISSCMLSDQDNNSSSSRVTEIYNTITTCICSPERRRVCACISDNSHGNPAIAPGSLSDRIIYCAKTENVLCFNSIEQLSEYIHVSENINHLHSMLRTEVSQEHSVSSQTSIGPLVVLTVGNEGDKYHGKNSCDDIDELL